MLENPRRVTGCSGHAIERYRIVDPTAGRYTILDECDRGTRISRDLALALRSLHSESNAALKTPDDGFILHRHGRVLFACAESRTYEDQLYCVTALRLGPTHRRVLAGLWQPPSLPYGSDEDDAVAAAAPAALPLQELSVLAPTNALGSTLEHVTPFGARAVLLGYAPSAARLARDLAGTAHTGGLHIWISRSFNNARDPEMSADGRHLLVNANDGTQPYAAIHRDAKLRGVAWARGALEKLVRFIKENEAE